jgi:hypothetical protein
MTYIIIISDQFKMMTDASLKLKTSMVNGKSMLAYKTIIITAYFTIYG